MIFAEKIKKSLFRFIEGYANEKTISDIKNYVVLMRQYDNFEDYCTQHIKHERSTASTSRERRKFISAQSSLAIIAGLYYGSPLSLQRLEEEGEVSIDREELKSIIIPYTERILFGKKDDEELIAGVPQIENIGLINLIDNILGQPEFSEEGRQRSELLSRLEPYKVLSDKSFNQASVEAERKIKRAEEHSKENVITHASRHEAQSATSFTEMVKKKNPSAGKRVTFSNKELRHIYKADSDNEQEGNPR